MSSANDALCQAAWNGTLEDVKHALHLQGAELNGTNFRGQTALYCAARTGSLEVVKFLLSLEDIQVNLLVEPHGSSALHAAGFAGHEIVTALLLSAGADPLLTNAAGLTAHQDMQGDARNAYKIFNSGGISALQKHYPEVKKLNKGGENKPRARGFTLLMPKKKNNSSLISPPVSPRKERQTPSIVNVDEAFKHNTLETAFESGETQGEEFNPNFPDTSDGILGEKSDSSMEDGSVGGSWEGRSRGMSFGGPASPGSLDGDAGWDISAEFDVGKPDIRGGWDGSATFDGGKPGKRGGGWDGSATFSGGTPGGGRGGWGRGQRGGFVPGPGPVGPGGRPMGPMGGMGMGPGIPGMGMGPGGGMMASGRGGFAPGMGPGAPGMGMPPGSWGQMRGGPMGRGMAPGPGVMTMSQCAQLGAGGQTPTTVSGSGYGHGVVGGTSSGSSGSLMTSSVTMAIASDAPTQAPPQLLKQPNPQSSPPKQSWLPRAVIIPSVPLKINFPSKFPGHIPRPFEWSVHVTAPSGKIMKDIFSQFNLPDNSKYIFATLSGMRISKSSDFAAFGAGSILASWELNVVEDPDPVCQSPVVLSSRAHNPDLSEKKFSCLFIIPAFLSLQPPASPFFLLLVSLNQSLLDVREKICSLYKEKEASGEAKTPSRFAGMSVVIKNLEGVIFDLGLNFASLGLGTSKPKDSFLVQFYKVSEPGDYDTKTSDDEKESQTDELTVAELKQRMKHLKRCLGAANQDILKLKKEVEIFQSSRPPKPMKPAKPVKPPKPARLQQSDSVSKSDSLDDISSKSAPELDKSPQQKPRRPEGTIAQWVERILNETHESSENNFGFPLVGPPRVLAYGPSSTAWTAKGRSKIKLKFERSVYITHVNILESFNPGPIYKVTAKRPAHETDPKKELRKKIPKSWRKYKDEEDDNAEDENNWQVIWKGNPEIPQENLLNVLEIEPDAILSFCTDTIAIYYDTKIIEGDEIYQIAAVQLVGYEKLPDSLRSIQDEQRSDQSLDQTKQERAQPLARETTQPQTDQPKQSAEPQRKEQDKTMQQTQQSKLQSSSISILSLTPTQTQMLHPLQYTQPQNLVEEGTEELTEDLPMPLALPCLPPMPTPSSSLSSNLPPSPPLPAISLALPPSFPSRPTAPLPLSSTGLKNANKG